MMVSNKWHATVKYMLQVPKLLTTLVIKKW